MNVLVLTKRSAVFADSLPNRNAFSDASGSAAPTTRRRASSHGTEPFAVKVCRPSFRRRSDASDDGALPIASRNDLCTRPPSEISSGISDTRAKSITLNAPAILLRPDWQPARETRFSVMRRGARRAVPATSLQRLRQYCRSRTELKFSRRFPGRALERIRLHGDTEACRRRAGLETERPLCSRS